MSRLSSAPISDKYVALLMQQPHVVLATGTVVQGLTGFRLDFGIDFAAFNQMSGGFSYLSGGDPVNDNDMVVDEYYAQQHHLQVGSELTLIDHDWKVSGNHARAANWRASA